MKENSNHTQGDRRVEEGLFQWREDYNSQFEHFTESIKAAQEDYNNLSQKFLIAKTPYDLVQAWSAFVQQRMSHFEHAFHNAVESGAYLKPSVHRTTKVAN